MDKKTMLAAAFSLALAISAAAATPAPDTLICHRGESHDAPENTLPAYKMAVERGFGFECDIYLSKDGRVFTFHDGTLKRTSGGANTKACNEATWDEVSKLDVGSWGKWKGSKFAGARPALFEEVLELARDGRWIYVDVKSKTGDIVPYVKAILEKQTKANPGNTLFLCGAPECGKEFKRLLPEYKVLSCLNCRRGWKKGAPPVPVEEIIATTKEMGADGVDIRYAADVTTPEYMKAIKDAGLELHVWTVDRLPHAVEAFKRGAQTVTTNCAKKLLDEYTAGSAPAEEDVPAVRLAARKAFADLKFGIFLHWGFYAMYAQGEWYLEKKGLKASEYEKAANAFYPHDFDALEWCKAFRDAGAKYVVFTTRHHDGFSMFDTKASDYDIVDATPFKRDVVKELAEACRKTGLKLGFYYSLMDWRHPAYPTGERTKARSRLDNRNKNYAEYLAFMKVQLTELLTNYGDVLSIWFDGEWDHAKDATPFDWKLGEIYDLIHTLQPQCLIVNNHHHAMRPGEDVQCFERDIPGQNKAGFSGEQTADERYPKETCDTMVNGHWGYCVTDTDWKSPAEVKKLIRQANERGANLLLNIGPQADGNLPPAALEILSKLQKD